MRTLILSVVSLFIGIQCHAQMSSIHGTIESDHAKEICFFVIEDGTAKVYARTSISPSGQYGFLIEIPEEGFYAIGFDQGKSLQIPVYLKPGDNANIDIRYSREVHSAVFSKKNTPENKTFGRWFTISETVRNKSLYTMGGPGSMSTYEDFYPDLEALASKTEEFKKTVKTKNKQFNALMEELVDFNTEFYALHFFRMPRTKWPEEGYPQPAIYSEMIRFNRFPDDHVLGTLYGASYLDMYIHNALKGNTSEGEINRYMGTDRLREVYFLPTVLRARDHASYLLLMKQYGKYFTSDAARKAVEEVGAKLYEVREGGKASDFTYPDINGKDVSLSDFIGKVVVVDVWATWCGPCLAQIPFLKKLEEEYENNDQVVFLAVSVDEAKDYEKWKAKIKEDELPGIHLFASGWSKIAKDYKITGIPRFMVFDKAGNIVSSQAPRPSDPNLKLLIEQELAK